MPKILKIAVILVATLALVLLIIVLVLPRVLDAQIFREQLIEQVKVQSGQDLRIEGGLSFKFFPWFGLSVGGIRLIQPPFLSKEAAMSTEENWLYIQRADVQAKLLPLLKKQLVIQNIYIYKPKIHYIIAQNGRTSLDGFTAKSDVNQSPPIENASGPKTKLFGSHLWIAGASIKEGELILDDRRSGEKIQVSHLNFNMDDLLSGGFESIRFSARVSTSAHAPINLELSSQARIDLDQQSLSLTRLFLNAGSDNTKNMLELTADQIDFDQLQQVLKMEGLKARGLLDDLAPSPVKPLLSFSKIDVDLSKEILHPVEFSLQEKKLGIELNGKFSVSDLLQAPFYKGEFSSNRISPKKMLKNLAIDYQTRDSSALKLLQINSQFNGNARGLAFQNIEATLDQSVISGHFSVVDFANHSSRFDLTLNALNLDRYLSKKSETSATESMTGDTGASQNPDSFLMGLGAPMAVLRTIPSQGIFRATQFQVNNIQLQEIEIVIDSSHQEVIIRPTAQLYQGSISAKVNYQSEQTNSQAKIISELQDVSLGPLLRDAGISSQLTGTGFISTDLSLAQINNKFTRRGSIRLKAINGAIKGAAISGIILQLRNDLSEKCIELQQKYFLLVEKIDKRCREWDMRLQKYQNKKSINDKNALIFSETNAEIQLKDAILDNQSLLVKGEEFYIKGQGEINTANRDLDYRVVLNLTDSHNNDNSLLLTIPFAAKGSLSNIKFVPDYSNFLNNLAEEFADSEKIRLKEKLQEKLKISDPEKEEATQPAEELLEKNLKKQLLDKLFR